MRSKKVQRQRLDRALFARLVAAGTSATEAARKAGSHARYAANVGCRMLAESATQRLVRAEREAIITGVADDLELAKERARQTLRDPKAKGLWRFAWDFLAKIAGAYAPEKHDHRVFSLADLVQTVHERRLAAAAPPVLPEPVNRVEAHLEPEPQAEKVNGNGTGNGHA